MRRSHVLFCGFTLALAAACGTKKDDPSLREDALTVVRFDPLGTTYTTRPIHIHFSKPLVSKSVVDKAESEPRELVTITPRINYDARWIQPDVLELVPLQQFEQSTRYRIAIRPEIAGEKLTLLGTTEFELNTKMFELLSVEPYFETKDALRVRVNLQFSYPVRPADAKSAISFWDKDKKLIGAKLASENNGEVMAFELDPLPLSTEDRTIDVRIEGSLGAIGGGEPLGKQIVRSISLAKPEVLTVIEVSPVQNGEKYQAQIRLSTNVEIVGAAKYVEISPAIEYRLIEQYHGMIVDAAFEPGKTYELTVKRGLTGQNGALLAEDVRREMTPPDLEPALRFGSGGTYLLKSGRRTIGVETVNVKKLGVRVSKVFENNLAHLIPKIHPAATRPSCEDCEYYEGYEGYEGDYGSGQTDLSTLGRTVLSDATIAVEDKKNQLLNTTIAFDDLDLEDRRGLYRLEVFDRDRSWVRLEKWLVATDLGIVAKVGPGYARAQLISLADNKPVPDVEVAFISRTNETLGTGITNAAGVAQIRGSFEREGEPLSLIVAKKGRDFSYLALSGSAVSTQELDSGGSTEPAAPYRAFVSGERGIYRPGDRAQLTVLVREPSLQTPPAFPLELEVRDPAWRLFQKIRGNTGDQGAFLTELNFPNDAPTGRYVVRVLAAGGVELGQTTLMVEDFMPDRLKVDVTAKNKSVELGTPAEFTVQSNYLFGPKAAGLRLEAQCTLTDLNIASGEFAGFFFLSEEATSIGARTIDLGDSTLDEEGRAELSCALEEGTTLHGPARATVLAVVSEEGGRAVSGAGSAVLHPFQLYAGLRRNAQDSYVAEGQDAALEAIVVDRDGQAKKGAKLTVSFIELEWHNILKLVNNRYMYVSESSEKVLNTSQLTTERGPTNIPFVPAKQGEYKIVVEEEGGARASIRFWVSGSGTNAWSMRYPDRVAMTLDKTTYRPGETAKVMVRAPFEGRLYLSVEREQVLWAEDVELTGNTGTFNIPVLDLMSPNAFIVAELIRSPNSREKLAPARAYGVTPLMVDADSHRLTVTVHPDDGDIRPNTPLHVRVKVLGAEKRAFMVVSAVDEGILQITNFATPDPFAYFTQRRRLSLRTHDLYSALLPEELTPASALSSGSGGDGEVRRRHLNPISVKRVKPIALWSGLVPVGPDGWGVVTLDVPEFNGSLRVMAVAWSDDRFGAGAKNVTVRDPLVLTPTLPRFVAPLDKLVMPVEVYNGTKKAGEVAVKLAIDGRIKAKGALEQTVKLAADERKTIEWELETDEVIGAASIVLTAAGNGHATKSTTELGIRPASTTISESKIAAARFNENAVLKIPGGFIPSSVRARVKIGPTPSAQLGPALDYLLQYPYGCLEQTTSRAFPLLYVRELARREGVELSRDTLVDYHVNGAIDRILGMILPEGALSFWPGGSWGYVWTTIYATHFLTEAKTAGFSVDQSALDVLYPHLARIAAGVTLSGYNTRPDFKSQVYALYVLSLAGKPEPGALQFAAERLLKSNDPATPEGMRVPSDEETRALLAGALALAGNRAKANELFGLDFASAPLKPNDGFWTPARQDALTLAVLVDLAPNHRDVPKLMDSVAGRARDGRWANTQENAYALMALGKAYKKFAGKEYWGVFTAGEVVEKRFTNVIVSSIESNSGEWIGKDLTFSVTGAGTAFISLSYEGIKAGLLPPKSDQLTISRRFLDSSGNPLDINDIHQGDLLITELTVKPKFPSGRVDNVAIVDLLPAGLEIENPRLLNAGASLPWLQYRTEPDHVDVRDDRILFFGSISADHENKYYYAARAVTRGTFTLPHAFVEAMYDPTYQAYDGGGKFTVLPRPQ